MSWKLTEHKHEETKETKADIILQRLIIMYGKKETIVEEFMKTNEAPVFGKMKVRMDLIEAITDAWEIGNKIAESDAQDRLKHF